MSLFETEYCLFDNLDGDINGFILRETGVVLPTDTKLKASIEVRVKDSRFEYEPYMKISKNSNKWNLSNKYNRVRISLKNPKYIYHDSDPGEWKLNSKEKKLLMRDLSSPYNGDSSKTLWEEILDRVYTESEHKCDLRNSQMPDYTKLQ